MGNNSTERGKQHTPRLAQQGRDFSGLRYDKITPTDIDALLEFGDKLFVFIETKLPGVAMDRGQQLALERVVDAIAETGRRAIGIVCEHENRDGDINFALCGVTEYRWLKQWRVPVTKITAREAVDRVRALALGKTN